MELIRILILHRSRLAREAIASALENSGPFRTIDLTLSTNIERNLEIIRVLHDETPDVVMLDLDFPFRTGLADARRILDDRASTRIVMTGVPLIESEVLACIETGVAGCELEDDSLPELSEIIQAVHAGEHRCSPKITRLLFRSVSRRAKKIRAPIAMPGHARLTPRELEITELIERGLRNKEIADYLGIEVQTVKNHVHNVLEKLQLRGRRDLARYARDRGLLVDSYKSINATSESTST